MPLSEDKAVEVLLAIVNRPGTVLKDVPGVWAELLDVYAKRYDATTEHSEPAIIRKQNRQEKPAVAGALLDCHEAAALLGVKPHTLNVWACHRTCGPAFVKVGRRRMYSPDAIEAYINGQTVQVGEA